MFFSTRDVEVWSVHREPEPEPERAAFVVSIILASQYTGGKSQK